MERNGSRERFQPIGRVRRPSDIELVGVELVSGLFILIGLAAFALLFVSINSDTAIRAVTRGEIEGSLVLVFLDSFGIVVPLLVIAIGALMIRLGFRLRTRDVTAGRWAQVALVWLIIGLVAFTALSFYNGGQPAPTALDKTFDPASALGAALPFLILLVPLVAALVWLNRVLHEIFPGEETISASDARAAWNLLIPTLAVLIIVAARPLEQTFITSLTDKRFAGTETPNFVGLNNYTKLLNLRLDTVTCRKDDESGACQMRPDGAIRWESIDRELLQDGYRTSWNIRIPGTDRAVAISSLDANWIGSIWTTLVFTVVSVTLELIIGLFIAMTVNSNFRGRGAMRAVMLVPWAIPTVISARLWELMLKDSSAGIINKILLDLRLIDAPQAWLANPALQVPSAILVDVWKTAPFMALLLLAGLQTMPAEMYEAASVDGAGKIRQLFTLTLPLLRPTIAVALVFRTLDALRVFDLFNVLFGRQQLTMATMNYETLVNNQQDGYAAAIGVLIFFLIFIFAVAYVRMLGVETE